MSQKRGCDTRGSHSISIASKPAIRKVNMIGRVEFNGFRILGHSCRIILVLESLIAFTVYTKKIKKVCIEVKEQRGEEGPDVLLLGFGSGVDHSIR